MRAFATAGWSPGKAPGGARQLLIDMAAASTALDVLICHRCRRGRLCWSAYVGSDVSAATDKWLSLLDELIPSLGLLQQVTTRLKCPRMLVTCGLMHFLLRMACTDVDKGCVCAADQVLT